MTYWKRFLILSLGAVLFIGFSAIAAGLMQQPSVPNPSTLAADQGGLKEYYLLTEQMAHGIPLSYQEKQRLNDLHDVIVRPGRTNSLDNTGGPDEFGYIFMDNVAPDTCTYDWIELRGDDAATWINSWTSHDDGYSTESQAIGFPFPFYGNNYEQFFVTSNGQIEFGDASPFNYLDCVPVPSAGPAIFPFMYDLHLDNGGVPGGLDVIGYRTFDTYTVIEFDSIGYWSANCFGSLKFEVILYNTGKIKFQYNTLNQPANCASQQLIGIQNSETGPFLQYACHGEGPMLEDGRAIWFLLPNGMPVAPAALTASVAGSNVTLSWTDPTHDTNDNPITISNIEVWLGAPSVGQLLGTVAAGVQTYIHANAPVGNLRYYVRAFNDPYFGSPAMVAAAVGTASYIEGFEITNGMWVSEGGWEWGAPTNGNAPEPHSTPNVWAVGLTRDYLSGRCYHLTLTPELAINSPAATVEFWCWYNIVQWNDGCNFKISVDNGINWELVTPEDGYPQPNIWGETCIGTIDPCWSGSSGNWQHIILPIGQWNGQTPIFRFDFGSSNWSTGPGFFIDDMEIWGLQPPQGADISGTISFDGGAGVMTQVTVRASGMGNPNTHPLANGSYTLTNVLRGPRTVSAELANYVTSYAQVDVPQGGLTNINLTLRRVPPPTPTGLVATVSDSALGIVSLNWDNSTDVLVDQYFVYRRLRGEHSWTHVRTFPVSQGVDTLAVPVGPGPGIYQYSIAAVDTNVTTPSVSPQSQHAEVLFGELPPTSLLANGRFDDHIHLRWLAPGVEEVYQLAYDDSTAENWTTVSVPNGTQDFLAVRFTPPSDSSASYPLPVQSVNIYMQETTPLTMVMICPDMGGAPDLDNSYMRWTNIGAEESPGWLIAQIEQTVMLPDQSDFWVIWQLPAGIVGPGTGTDNFEPDGRSYLTTNLAQWNLWAWGDWMCRVWLGGTTGRASGFVLSVGEPSGYSVNRIPATQIVPASVPEGEIKKSSTPVSGPIREVAKLGFFTENPPHASPFNRPYSMAPALEYRPNPGSSLDEVLFYKLYKNNVDISHPTATTYDDFAVTEGSNYSYRVTAWYDNGVESGTTATITAAANMPPGAPGEVSGAAQSATTIQIFWTDPTSNADGTNCVDLAHLRIYRDGVLIATVNPGVQQYLDTPPNPGRTYTWTVKAMDEVPNEGPGNSYAGSVIDPFMESDYEWIDISENGTNTGLSSDDQSSGPFTLGFTVNFYGEEYTSIHICSNGFVSFTSATTVFWESSIPSIEDPNAAIYALWDDLTLSSGQCLYYQDVANQQFIISYIDVPLLRSFTDINTFQIIIKQTGEVKLQYQQVPDVTSCLVGVENALGTNAIQLYLDGAGEVEPTAEMAISFWGPPPLYARVDGTVSLDGGAGNVAQAFVNCNGVSHLSVHPAATGAYLLNSVQTGNRRFTATLDGYVPDTLVMIIPDTNAVHNVNLVLRRENPPEPTEVTGAINSATGIVTLNWSDSPDPLVDGYRVYRKLFSDATWQLRHMVWSRTHSNDADTVTAIGIYEYSITAIDTNVILPAVESAHSDRVRVLFGELPPNACRANGNFDNKIQVRWLAPGPLESRELYYDDGGFEGFLNWDQYGAVKFTPPSPDSITYPLPIQTCNIFMENSELVPEVMICTGTDNAPDMNNPLMTWTEIGSNDSPGWMVADAQGDVLLEDSSIFWVVVHLQPNGEGPGLGQDMSAPSLHSYSSWNGNEWFQSTWMNLMIHVWVGNEPPPPPAATVSTIPSHVAQGKSLRLTPAVQTTKTVESSGKRAVGPITATKKKTSAVSKNVSVIPNPWQTVTRAAKSRSEISRNSSGANSTRVRGTLDDVTTYKVYRNGVFLAQVPATQTMYDNTGLQENVPYIYHITAMYDNGIESAASNTDTAVAAMPPAECSSLTADAVGTLQMRLTWINPTTNQDGTPCIDLQGVRVYRDGEFIADLTDGIHQYTDTPPENNVRYTWCLRAYDEVPNYGPDNCVNGAVVSPWVTVDYEWVDISNNGTACCQGIDRNEGPFPLGFTFNYYGNDYTDVQICSNGWVSFTSTSSSGLSGTIPSTWEPNCALYAFWSNIDNSGNSIYYRAEPENHRFIISYDNVRHLWNGQFYTFQIIIGERGSVTYYYQSMPQPNAGLVGVENEDGTDAIQLYANSSGEFVPENNTAVQFWGGPSGELAGNVRIHTSNLPMQDVKIYALGVGDTILTDASGNYVYGLDPGTYSVVFRKVGFCDSTVADVIIEDNTQTALNVRMRAPSYAVNVSSLSYETWPGHSFVIPIVFSNPAGNCPLEFTISDTTAWLNAVPATGEVNPGTTQTINVEFLMATIPPGAERHAALTIHHNASAIPASIPVDLIVAIKSPDPDPTLPTEFAFYQNYPNPFNATTALKFDVPQESRVKISIFNVLGQQVAAPVDGLYTAGRHSVSYTAMDLPSGMYIVRMEAGNFSALSKMMLLK